MKRNFIGVRNEHLDACPKSPNCVSTQTDQKEKQLEPLPFIKTFEETKQIVKKVIDTMDRTVIKEETEDYLQAVSTSKFFRFKDDIEFYFDHKAGLVHFRSGSRAGYYDFNVNRRRMEEFSVKYLQHKESKTADEL
ncbi:DUF1499 domain-containing protein [Halobacillus sp. Marseille-Q1614]|uniref:DUF1499 domain-containing protein n=1 Tax=Halobacillus sp. Marseille-Q1614 TaxID=2709134 RepID=UPI00157136BC|nr:DUF1499 domain-containing protein [Halobacillus sp. Marseille-Q1614]